MATDIEELAATISQWIDESLTLVTDRTDLLGNWESTLLGRPERDDGNFIFGVNGSAQSRWNRTAEWVTSPYEVCEPGILCLFVSDQDSGQNWQFRATNAMYYVFRAQSGRIVLSNDDTSILRILTRE